MIWGGRGEAASFSRLEFGVTVSTACGLGVAIPQDDGLPESPKIKPCVSIAKKKTTKQNQAQYVKMVLEAGK